VDVDRENEDADGNHPETENRQKAEEAADDHQAADEHSRKRRSRQVEVPSEKLNFWTLRRLGFFHRPLFQGFAKVHMGTIDPSAIRRSTKNMPAKGNSALGKSAHCC